MAGRVGDGVQAFHGEPASAPRCRGWGRGAWGGWRGVPRRLGAGGPLSVSACPGARGAVLPAGALCVSALAPSCSAGRRPSGARPCPLWRPHSLDSSTASLRIPQPAGRRPVSLPPGGSAASPAPASCSPCPGARSGGPARHLHVNVFKAISALAIIPAALGDKYRCGLRSPSGRQGGSARELGTGVRGYKYACQTPPGPCRAERQACCLRHAPTAHGARGGGGGCPAADGGAEEAGRGREPVRACAGLLSPAASAGQAPAAERAADQGRASAVPGSATACGAALRPSEAARLAAVCAPSLPAPASWRECSFVCQFRSSRPSPAGRRAVPV